MQSGYLLAIDCGTTNVKALLVDAATLSVAAVGSRQVPISFPAPGWVEQDADLIWSATLEAVDDCLGQVPEAGVVGLALSSQRESAVIWSRSTGLPLGPVLGWQDARTAEACEAFDAGVAELVRARTGLSLDAMFSAPKMRWLLDAALADGVDVDDICLGTVDSWLVWNLTGEHAAEAGNASRTLLFNIHTLEWDPDLLGIFGIPATSLGGIRASDAGFGLTIGAGKLLAGVPVAAVLADSHAAMYRHGCTEWGAGKATYGTGSSVMTPCSDASAAPSGIATTLAWLTDEPTYAREGNIVATGSAVDWMARMIGVESVDPGGAFLTTLAADVPDSGGVCFVPAFAGLGAPYWDRSAVGTITGVTGGTSRAHLARATLESVAHQVADVVEAMEADGGARIDVLHADGGGSASRVLMTFQADVLNRPVQVSDVPEASALGAAMLARRALGLATAEPTDDGGSVGQVIQPTMSDQARRARRAEWAQAVARSRGQSTTIPTTTSTTTSPNASNERSENTHV
jgi:glycerol kinase